jgi:hypothetical protein
MPSGEVFFHRKTPLVSAQSRANSFLSLQPINNRISIPTRWSFAFSVSSLQCLSLPRTSLESLQKCLFFNIVERTHIMDSGVILSRGVVFFSGASIAVLLKHEAGHF